HGGSLTARSAGPGAGSTFTLELPIAGSPPAATRDMPIAGETSGETLDPTPFPEGFPANPPPPAGEPLRGRLPALRILLVEDNRDTLRCLAMVLRARGHRVVEAENLAAARVALDAEPLDLVVSDIELPDG